MLVVLVYLEWFRRISLLKCVSQPETATTSLKPLFLGSRSFKVIDVGTSVREYVFYVFFRLRFFEMTCEKSVKSR